MRTPNALKNPGGFTLIELLVTLAILAVLASLAAPSFRNTIDNQALSGVVSDLQSSILQARSEALKTNRNVVIIPNTGTNWSSGWQAFVDVGSNSVFDSGTDTMIIQRPEISASVLQGTQTNSSLIGFDSRGYLRPFGLGNQTIIFQSQRTMRKRLIVIDGSGRSRICAPEINSTCCPTGITC